MLKEVKFVTWNVQGLRCEENRGTSFTYLRQLEADVVALQETHTEERDHRHWGEMWGGPTAWTSHVGLLLRDGSGLSFASTPVSHLDGRVLTADIVGDAIASSAFSVICIYAPAVKEDREGFVEELNMTIRPGPRTILLGDLNAAPDPVLDRWPSTSRTDAEWEPYRRLMERHRLVDLYRKHNTTSRLWTWKRKLRDPTAVAARARIDHILVSPRLARRLSMPFVDIPPRSDHRPVICILRTLRRRQPGRAPWRFNAAHLNDSGFEESARERCKEFAELTEQQVQSGRVDIEELHSKWTHLKEDFKQQSITFGIERARRLRQRVTDRRQELRRLYEQPPDPNVLNAGQIDQWARQVQEKEDTMTERAKDRVEGMRIRARAKWTEKGERSTAYFFRRLRARRAAVQIDRLTDEQGREVTDIDGILGITERFYTQLFERVDTDPQAEETLLQQVSQRIGDDMQAWLDREIELEEITEAIRTAPTGSAPGPDGITFEFYKRFSAILAPALAILYNSCRAAGSFPLSFRQTHIILLPKRGDLASLANWRPISLSDCDIKILTRVLTYRMQSVSQHCIHATQTGFIRGRSIFDNIHAIHLALQSGMINPAQYSGALLLLDQQKAYDRVDRGYLDRCLERFGIGPGFRSWVAMMGDEAQAAVRVGTSLSGWVPVGKGLRQGDPLSPLLYNFVLEPLLCTLRARLAGIRLPGYTLRTMAFADDVAVAVGDEHDVTIFQDCIGSHERASAARLNADKTVVLRVGQPRFEPPIQPIPDDQSTRYLGIMFSSKGLDSETMEARLFSEITATADRWQDRKLSVVGRTLLANTCMLAKLWFAAHIVPFTSAFEQKVRRRVRQFIWNSKRGRVAEEKITRPKSEGGLGLLPLREQAQAIFGNFLAKVCHPTSRPEWVPMAHGLLAHYLRQNQQDLSDMYARTEGVQNVVGRARSIPVFWRQVIQTWNRLGGRVVPVSASWHPLEVLTLPLKAVTTTINPVYRQYQLRTLPDRALSWRGAGANTLGDVIEWSPTRFTYVSRSTEAAQTVTADWRHYHWTVEPQVLQLLRPLKRPPSTGPPAMPFSKIRLMDGGVDTYRPKKARRYMQGKKPLAPRADRWADRTDPVGTSMDMLAWSTVFSSRLEPRHQSLLWLMQHGAVYTGRTIVHFHPDATSECPMCGTPYESLRHYFYECSRVREFWQLIGEFLDRIQNQPPAQSTPVELKDVLAGLPAWKGKVPSLIIFYALAVWQIYRAHTEAAMDQIRLPAIAMFTRWKNEVMRRIRIDHINAMRNNRMDRFMANWFSIRCQWFVFEPGEEGAPGRGRVEINATFATSGQASSSVIV